MPAKKPSSSARKPAVDVATAPAVKTTKARQSSVPPKSAKSSAKVAVNGNGTMPAVEITHAMIAERAYHLWRSGAPGGEMDHWCAAERELRAR